MVWAEFSLLQRHGNYVRSKFSPMERAEKGRAGHEKSRRIPNILRQISEADNKFKRYFVPLHNAH